jgi:hypothetical protein
MYMYVYITMRSGHIHLLLITDVYVVHFQM